MGRRLHRSPWSKVAKLARLDHNSNERILIGKLRVANDITFSLNSQFSLVNTALSFHSTSSYLISAKRTMDPLPLSSNMENGNRDRKKTGKCVCEYVRVYLSKEILNFGSTEIISWWHTLLNDLELILLRRFLAATAGTIQYEIVKYIEESSFLIVIMPVIYIIILVRWRTFCAHITRIHTHSKEQNHYE